MGAGCCSTESPLHDEIMLANISKKLTTKTIDTPPSLQQNIDSKQYLLLQQQLNEYKQKIDELQAENMELILTLNKFLAAHNSWDYEAVCEWMTTINNAICGIYKDTLLKKLKSEDITGKDLRQFDLPDLQRLGISSPQHQKIVLSHIKILTQDDSLPDTIADNNSDPNTVTDIETSQTLTSAETLHRMATQAVDAETYRKMTKRLTEIDFSDITRQFTHTETDREQIAEIANEFNLGIPLETVSYQPTTSTAAVEDFSRNTSLISATPTMLASKTIRQPSILTQDINVNKWKYTDGVLLIKVVKATGLSGMDEKSEIYVEMQLQGDYWQKEVTKVSDGMELVWNQRFQITVPNPKKGIVNFKIWKKRSVWDEKIGIVNVAVIDVLNIDGFVGNTYDIVEGKYGGQLELELTYKELSK